MSNLLSIETNFLSLSQVKAAINLTEIRSVQRTITNGQKKKFEQTLSLSKLVLNAVEWFHSEEGKRVCSEEGISWTNEEIGNKVFGWQKSFFYKVVKAAKLQDDVISTFKAKCDELETEGKDPNRSLEGLLKFAKQVETGTSESGNEGEGEGEGEGSEAQVETRAATILTFTYKPEGNQNVSVRIDESGALKTNNTKEQIQAAIEFLNGILLYNNL
jgi:hypothetical protein